MIKRNAVQQQCPICRATQPLSATRCASCGAVLPGVPLLSADDEPTAQSKRNATVKIPRQSFPPAEPTRPAMRRSEEKTKPSGPTWEDGETDLYEGALPSLPRSGAFILLAILVLIGVAAFVFSRRGSTPPDQTSGTPIAVGVLPTESG